METRVIKRDGRIKKYDGSRIYNAIKQSYLEVYGELSKELKIEFVNVYNFVDKQIRDDECTLFYVEKIQDMVVDRLMEVNPTVANSYTDFRQERSKMRDAKSELQKGIMGLIDNTNKDLMTENANKQAHIVSTQRDLMAGEVSKTIARSTLIPKHLLAAHDRGEIKIHDLDYFLNPTYNCELVNLDDMFQNGTVINKKKIRKPKSLRTAMTLATQIIAQVASNTYGGQTISLAHLAEFVYISECKIRKKYEASDLNLPRNAIEILVERDLRDEIKDSVQTFNYQVLTLMTTNGQAPFVSVSMYINEKPELAKYTAMLIEEFLKQRIAGMENEYGVVTTQTFPKLLYFLDENNIHEDSEYFYLTELAAKSTAIRMNPDYISVKKMKEIYGHAFPPMGCRAFLSPFQDKDGNWIFYGRGNLGVQSLNLPDIALTVGGDFEKFWVLFDERLELCRELCRLRYDKLKGVKASVAPILWQHGAIARLDKDDPITKAIDERGFTVTIGYSGLYETVKVLCGESHTSEIGAVIAERIMKYMKDSLDRFRTEEPHLRYALYGTPQESTTGWFCDKLKKKFGEIEDITDKGYITNSYHIDIREEIDAYEKMEREAVLQKYSTGGAVSYVETYNMQKNIPAVVNLLKHFYETIIYAEINTESDVCGKCKYEGVMQLDKKTMKWVCPNCGNMDQATLSVVRRTCGYLGETDWTDGRKLDIINRVKHI